MLMGYEERLVLCLVIYFLPAIVISVVTYMFRDKLLIYEEDDQLDMWLSIIGAGLNWPFLILFSLVLYPIDLLLNKLKK